VPYVRTQNQIKDKKNVLMQGEPRAAAVNFDTCRIFTARPHNLLCTAQIGMTIDPYHQRQKYRPITYVSGNIRCMRRFRPTVWPSLTPWHHVRTTPATIMRSLLEDSPWL